MKRRNIRTLALSLTALAALGLFISTGCNKSEVEPIAQNPTTTVKPPVKNTRSLFPVFEVTIAYGIDVEVNGQIVPCVGGGGPICHFDFKIVDYDCHPTEYFGSLTTNSDGDVIGHLEKEFMATECQELFDNGVVDMPQAKTIPLEIMEEIGFDNAYTIQAGEYSYTETATEFIINFDD